MDQLIIGQVTHYFAKIGVAVVKADKSGLKVGDRVKFAHAGKNFTQVVGSLQVNNQPVGSIKVGEEAGLKTDEPVKEGWLVYLAD